MQRRIDPDHELPGKGLLGLLAAFFAEDQLVLDRIAKCLPKLRHRTALKGDEIAKVHDLAVADPGIWRSAS
jgi:hypothetical protein